MKVMHKVIYRESQHVNYHNEHTPPLKLSKSVTSRSIAAVEMTSMMLTVAQAKGIR